MKISLYVASSIFFLIVLFSVIYTSSIRYEYDLTVVGQLKFAESLPRLSLGIIDTLKDDLKINFIPTPGDYNFSDVSLPLQNIIKNSDKRAGKVTLFVDMLWHIYGAPYEYVPKNSIIKIAYSMIESTVVPKEWVTILNKHFDSVVVPDIFYKQVYTASGVTIPIFVIPCGFYLEELFDKPLKTTVHTPFTFGLSAAFTPRKNYELLIQAFACAFGNNPQVQLKLHGRAGSNYEFIQNVVKQYRLQNVKIINKSFNRAAYNQFLSSLDCYVLLSKGEGFSLTPREALALGIPCIISNNTAHKTICETGFVYSVPSLVAEPAYYRCFGACWGNHFNCMLSDAQKALKEVYYNYSVYLQKAHQARPWLKQYLYKNLKSQILTLIKPRTVLLAEDNSLEKEILRTNSKTLYEKYLNIS